MTLGTCEICTLNEWQCKWYASKLEYTVINEAWMMLEVLTLIEELVGLGESMIDLVAVHLVGNSF